MTDLSQDLSLYIHKTGVLPVAWGESDCTAWPAKWVEYVHGRSLDLPRWGSADEAHAMIAEAGSLERLWSGALDVYGLRERLGDPVCGDVGIIETRIAGQVGVIFIHESLAALRGEPRGVRCIGTRQIVKAWAIQ